MNQFVFGALAIVGVIIVAMALSANKTGGTIVQAGLVIAILALLVRQTKINPSTGEGENAFVSAWTNVQKLAIGATGKQTGS